MYVCIGVCALPIVHVCVCLCVYIYAYKLIISLERKYKI